MPNRFDNLTGKQFGVLRVIRLYRHHSAQMHHAQWVCECECGRRFVKTASNLKRGKNLGCESCYRAHRKHRPFEAKYRALVRATEGRTSISLTYAQYLCFTATVECHYCGSPIRWLPYVAHGYNLDRTDNTRGYTQANCVVCCARCNRAKSDHFTYAEWKLLGDVIRSWK